MNGKAERLADAWFQGDRDAVRAEIPFLTVVEVLDIVARLTRLCGDAREILRSLAAFRLALEEAQDPIPPGSEQRRLVEIVRGQIARDADKTGRTYDEQFAIFKENFLKGGA